MYKAAWNHKEPFVHLCGRRYEERPEAETEIKVYSNQQKVALFVDGVQAAEKTGQTIFRFRVKLTGEHCIEVRAEGCSDSMRLRHVEKPNLSYAMVQKGEVVNWFDRENFREDCFSIQDTLGELMADPEAGKLGRCGKKHRRQCKSAKDDGADKICQFAQACGTGHYRGADRCFE